MDRAAQAVEQWNRERPDLDVGSMLLLGRLGEAALVIARERLNPLFADFGLQPGEFDVLATLRRSGDATMMSSGGMTNRIDRLQQAGWVERRPNPEDGRGTLVALTKAGFALIDKAVSAHVENQRAVLSVLTDAEQRQLAKLLAKLIDGQRADER